MKMRRMMIELCVELMKWDRNVCLMDCVIWICWMILNRCNGVMNVMSSSEKKCIDECMWRKFDECDDDWIWDDVCDRMKFFEWCMGEMVMIVCYW